MLRSICFVLCSVILLCEGAELLPRSRIHVEQDETIERGTSATITVQRYDGKAFYNYVKLAGELKNREEAPASGKDEKDQDVFAEPDEDDAQSPSTTLTPTTTADVVVVTASEDVTHPPSGNLQDPPSATGAPSAPSGPAEGGSIPESPPADQPNSGDAVPGQGEDADAESSSSSSSESSSSSSEEDERRSAWEKAWQYKLKNELIMRTGKSKDARKIYSHGHSTRFLKMDKKPRRI